MATPCSFTAVVERNLRQAHDLILEVGAPQPAFQELARHSGRRVLIKFDLGEAQLSTLAGPLKQLLGNREVALLIEIGSSVNAAADRLLPRLLALLCEMGLEVHALRDCDRRILRIRPPRAGPALMEGLPLSLYCQPPERALAVALVFHSPLLGGAERSLLSLAERLVRDHGAMVLGLLPGDGPLVARLERCGAAVHVTRFEWWCDPKPVPEDEQRGRLRRSLREVLAALPALSDFGPHVVVGNTLVQPWSLVLASLLEVPHVCRVSELGDEDHGLRFFLPIAEVEREVEDGSALLLASSDMVRRGRFPRSSKCRVVYPPVDVPWTPPREGRSVNSRRRFRVGNFSSVTPAKGQEDAVAALGELARRGHDVELLLAGHPNGSYVSWLREQAVALGVAERVRIAGLLEDPYADMVGCDAVVVCSRLEAFGRVAVEAMLLGVPLICTGRGGLAEITREGETALWYPAGDPRALADRLEDLLRDPAGGERRADAARREAVRFRGEQAGDIYASALRELRGAPGARLPRFLSRVGSGPRDDATAP